MADELRDIIESLRVRLQAELDGQLSALNTKHQQALVEARQHAEAEARQVAQAEAEQALAARIQAMRDEAQRRAQEAIASVHEDAQRRAQEAINAMRAEFERERAAEAGRLRAEAEHQAAEAAARVRAEMAQRAEEAASRVRAELEQTIGEERSKAQAIAAERDEAQALAAEREQARARAESDQRRAAEELETARVAFQASRDADRATFEASRAALEAQIAARVPSAPGADRLVAALRQIDAANSVSSTLGAIARAAAIEAPRAAVFVASGEQLREWAVPGVEPLTPAPLYVRDSGTGVIGEAVRRCELVKKDDGGAPAFASLAPGRVAVAAPLVLEGQPVGVLYADEAAAESGEDQWIDALDVIASHGSARLGYLTAVRTAQTRQWLQGDRSAAADGALSSSEEEEQAARRYARLLVSEIKLYNDAAVTAGRANRDLLRRLGTEIERARRMFEENVPASVDRRAQLFQHELVQTLAGGDAALLGS